MVWGVDLAKGIGPGKRGDYTCAIALDSRGRVCRFERWQDSWQRIEDRLADILGQVPAIVDSTGVGSPVVDRLIQRGLPVTPFVFTSPSKQMLMGGLAAAIHQRRIEYPDGAIREELEAYEYVYDEHSRAVKYSAPPGLHDDCVCSLALAVFHAERFGHCSITPIGVNATPTMVSVRDYYREKRQDPDWGF
jgi:hypothetical protein